MKFFKSIYFRLGLVSFSALLALLIVLPRVPIVIKNKFISIDSAIGGYVVNIMGDKFVKDLRDFKYGLDIRGGVRVVLSADMSKISSTEKDRALESAAQIIERRINLLGVAEPYITTVKSGGDYRIVAEIPGIDNVDAAVALIGQTAQLIFRELKPDKNWDGTQAKDYYMDPNSWTDTGLNGADLKGAEVTFSQGTGANQGQPEIQLKFTDEGRRKFSEVIKKNINKPVGIFFDNEPYPLSMPVVSPDLANGLTNDPVINGSFDIKTANALSVQLRAGALPVPVSILEQKTIGATLGYESVRKSFIAGAIGLVLVLLFMVFMYGRYGVIAGFALVIYALITLALFKLVPVVLTLPGIAGFILSVGMATDANVLIFERIKEELRWGKPRNIAVKLGFERAWSSIKDSNISSLITCAILFYLGTGPVKGFALTLALGIFVSLFSSIFVVKTLIYAFNLEKDFKFPSFLKRNSNANN